MFLDKYLNETKLKLLYNVYEEQYIKELEEENFKNIYALFKKYNFYFMDDIILNYLEIFEKDPNYVEIKILELNKQLGEKYIYIIGNDMRYLENI